MKNLDFVQKEEQTKPKDNEKFQWMVLSIFLGAIIVVVVSGIWGYVYYQNSQIKKTQNSISLLDEELGKLYDVKDQSEQLKVQVENTERLQREHIFWTPVLDEISRVTKDTVVFHAMTLNKIGGINITGDADTYTRVADQIDAFADSDLFSLAEISKASLHDSRVEFTMLVSLVDDALFQHDK